MFFKSKGHMSYIVPPSEEAHLRVRQVTKPHSSSAGSVFWVDLWVPAEVADSGNGPSFFLWKFSIYLRIKVHLPDYLLLIRRLFCP